MERLAPQMTVGPDVRADQEGGQFYVVGRFPAVALRNRFVAKVAGEGRSPRGSTALLVPSGVEGRQVADIIDVGLGHQPGGDRWALRVVGVDALLDGLAQQRVQGQTPAAV